MEKQLLLMTMLLWPNAILVKQWCFDVEIPPFKNDWKHFRGNLKSRSPKYVSQNEGSGKKVLELQSFLLQSNWWFQIFFILTPTCGNDSIWLIFSNGLKPPSRDVFATVKNKPLPIYTAQAVYQKWHSDWGSPCNISNGSILKASHWRSWKICLYWCTKFQTTKNSPLIFVDRNFLTKASILQKDEKVFQDIVPGYTLLLLHPF